MDSDEPATPATPAASSASQSREKWQSNVAYKQDLVQQLVVAGFAKKKSAKMRMN